MQLYAKLVRPESGYYHDTINVKQLNVLQLYKVHRVDMGQSNTSIYLEGKRNGFNSVQFEFYDEYGNEVDIYDMEEFNCYLKNNILMNKE